MKKGTAVFIVVCLILALFTACTNTGTASAPQEETTQVITVSTVDELIEAVAPGAHIRLSEGTYRLSDAKTFAQRSGNPYVKWVEWYGQGYALMLHDVDDLTIEGNGRENTRILSECPQLEVLQFEDCTNLTLSDFSAGHVSDDGFSTGGVMRFYRSEQVSLSRLGLSCASSGGLDADRVENLEIVDCDIYGCAASGIGLFGCKNVLISGTKLHDIGNEKHAYPAGFTVFSLGVCDTVTIENCNVENNHTGNFLRADEMQGLRLRGNRITGNSIRDGMFVNHKSETMIDSSNVFDMNSFDRWYAEFYTGEGVEYAVDEHGQEVYTESMEQLLTPNREDLKIFSQIPEFVSAYADDKP